MTAKQVRFVAEYLVDLNAKQAAIRAGYSPRSAEFQGSKLLADRKVSQALAEGQARQLEKAELSAVLTKEAIRRHVAADAHGDIRNLFDDKGNLRPIHYARAKDA